jgi:hypothetical protein
MVSVGTLLVVVVVLVGLAVFVGVGYSVVNGIYRVPAGTIGVVERRYGPGHPKFTEVNPGGWAGFQASVLLPNRIYLRPAGLFRVTYHPRTVVPLGTIGLVVAKEGPHQAPSQLLGTHVECNLFQDGRAFLLGGGQQGKQAALLRAGQYNINPMLFDVLTVDTIGTGRYELAQADLREIAVPVGSTGVVITMAGARINTAGSPDAGGVSRRPVGPVIAGHHFFELPWVFLTYGGYLGTQAETLPEGGLYRINPWFGRVVFIPTRDLILEFTNRDGKPPSNFDAALDEMRVNVEGHWLRFDITQIIRIPPEAAPGLVGSFGEQGVGLGRHAKNADRMPVQQFVEKVLGATVQGHFRETAGEYHALEFVDSDDVRRSLQKRVLQELSAWGVIAVRTTLREFRSEDNYLDDLRRSMARERDIADLLHNRERNAAIQARIQDIELQPGITAEEKRRLIDVRLLQEKIDRLGDLGRVEILLSHLEKFGVPAIIGGDASAILEQMPLATAMEIINRIMPDYGMIAGRANRPAVPAAPEHSQPEPADDQS